MSNPVYPVPTRKRRKVALLIETSNAFARGLLAGIQAYIRTDGHWNVYLTEHGRGDRAPDWLSGWDGDGIIARVENQTIASALADL
jgi:LacI family transcriptional regulator